MVTGLSIAFDELGFNSVIKLITKERGKKTMHAKKLDKLATAVLYTIAGIIVTILASLILYILVRGLPHVLGLS